MHAVPVERVVNLLDPATNVLLNMSHDEALACLASGRAEEVRKIDGQFALLHKQGITIRMARTLGRPMRYFLAKQAAGPTLIVAERMDQIRDRLNELGLGDQFHPSYTRMVPAHHVLELTLVGCPDPRPSTTRFFTPQRNQWGTDLTDIGRRYIGTLAQELDHWLDQIDPREPLGVLFSGGIDSGALFVTLYHRLMQRGTAPQRLKAFTLSVDEQGTDIAQARDFLDQLDLGLFLEVIDVPEAAIDIREAVRLTEDYKPLDVQAAAAGIALCRGIRERYPDWRYLVDGDGGDENLKDYPIEANPELTIRSVLNNLMLYQEGWGVNAVKHSQTYSGGQSRGHVRTFAPARHFGFQGFSPYSLPNVIEVAEGIPFIELTDWDHQRLYTLKGEIVRRGIEELTGITMPVFEKRRFQEGIGNPAASLFPQEERVYRRLFEELVVG
ncbi:MAG: asparagine synthetase B family protein [Planctomycetaceae bacterium]|nr:asparagine synthetase B family protein [Planctomycetaceae bacterium]